MSPPLLQVNSLVREIEVSHWGNIYVEEKYEIVSVRQICILLARPYQYLTAASWLLGAII